MRSLWPLWVTVISTLAASAQAASDLSVSDVLQRIPPCALECVLDGLSSNPETASDPTSSCLNITLQASLSTCVQGQCNATEQAKLGLLNAELCEGFPIDSSRVWAMAICGLIFGPLALTAILLRIYTRYGLSQHIGADDWVIVAAAPIIIAVTVMDIHSALGDGFGRHYWNFDPLKVVPFLKSFYAAEILYIIAITLVKTSILLFYLRVFPGRTFRRFDIGLQALNLVACLAVLMAIVFQCTPIRGAWDHSIPSKCINLNVLAYATGGIVIVLDILILVLPVPLLVSLKMNLRKKLEVLFMFSVGAVATAISITRLRYLVHFSRSKDSTWDNALPSLFSLLEIMVAVICACLPSMRALLSLWFPNIFSPHSVSHTNRTPNYKGGAMYAGQANSQSSEVRPVNRSIRTPDLELLDKLDNRGGRMSTQVWVKGGHASNDKTSLDSISKSETPSSNSSIFAFEGPRDSDEIAMLEQRDFPMQNFNSSPPNNKTVGNLIRVETTTMSRTSSNPDFKRSSPKPTTEGHSPP